MAPPTFQVGDFVRERGGAISGQILGRGPYVGEWRLARPDGSEILCLDETLSSRDENGDEVFIKKTFLGERLIHLKEKIFQSEKTTQALASLPASPEQARVLALHTRLLNFYQAARAELQAEICALPR